MPPVTFFSYKAPSSSSTTYSWVGTGNGNWSDATKWATGVAPNSATITPSFKGAPLLYPSIPYTVTMSDMDRTVAGLEFGSLAETIFAGSKTLTLAPAGGAQPRVFQTNSLDGGTANLRIVSNAGLRLEKTWLRLGNANNSIVGPIDIVDGFSLSLIGAGTLGAGANPIMIEEGSFFTILRTGTTEQTFSGPITGAGYLNIASVSPNTFTNLDGYTGMMGLDTGANQNLFLRVDAGETRSWGFKVRSGRPMVGIGYTHANYLTKIGAGVGNYTAVWDSPAGFIVSAGTLNVLGGVSGYSGTGNGYYRGQVWHVRPGATLTWSGDLNRRLSAGGNVSISGNTQDLYVSGSSVSFSGPGITAGFFHVGDAAGTAAAPKKSTVVVPDGRVINVYAKGRFTDWYGSDYRYYEDYSGKYVVFSKETCTVHIGFNDYAPAALYQTGGEINLKVAIEGGSGSSVAYNRDAAFMVGRSTLNGYGYYRGTGGSVNYPYTPNTMVNPTGNGYYPTVAQNVDILGGYSIFEVDGATINLNTGVRTRVGSEAAGGAGPSTPAAITMRSGTANFGIVEMDHGFAAGTPLTGPRNTINVLGGFFSCASLTVSNFLSTIAISGGTFRVGGSINTLVDNGTLTAVIELNGGTLGFSNSTPTSSSTSSTVQQRVYKDSNISVTAGSTVYWNCAFVAPAGHTISQINVVNGGSGYIGAPFVSITGGTGVRATAVASVGLDPADTATYGKVTSVTVVSPGSGYAAGGAPTIAFLGGGGTGATATATLTPASANSNITKTGPGTMAYAPSTVPANAITGFMVAAEGALLMYSSNSAQLRWKTVPGGTLISSASGTASAYKYSRSVKKLVLDGGTYQIGGV